MDCKWKIRVNLYDCDRLYEETVAEEDIPFLPNIGDAFWPSEKAEEELEALAKKCWNERKCENCPYSYGDHSSEEDISVNDYIFVRGICHDVSNKTVKITLSDR